MTEAERRKIKESLDRSKDDANAALGIGLVSLERLQQQGSRLDNVDDNLNPLIQSGENSEAATKKIQRMLKSDRFFFFLLLFGGWMCIFIHCSAVVRFFFIIFF